MAQTLADVKFIDVDTHVTEPPDLWTARVQSQKWGRQVLHVRENDPPGKGLGWYIGDEKVYDAPAGARGAWLKNSEYPPNTPISYEDIHEGTYSIKPRLQWMDEHNVQAQVIYPNVGGFGASQFLKMDDSELRLECVRAYNDFLTDWCAPADGRLIPIAALPIWDVKATLIEMERAIKMGHRGILLSNTPETLGLPLLADEYWDPIWEAADHFGVPVNFHVGGGDLDAVRALSHPRSGRHANFARSAVLFFLDNAACVTELITAGICHRYPKLNFVSVESGIGWVPFILEAMDWQWLNSGVPQEHPEYDLLPSEYFRRQWYACFWFERETPTKMLEFIGPQSVMFETDFPHPTSLVPGPRSIARTPREHIEEVFRDFPIEWTQQVLWDNPAKLYGVAST